jgi:hypothetical protein
VSTRRAGYHWILVLEIIKIAVGDQRLRAWQLTICRQRFNHCSTPWYLHSGAGFRSRYRSFVSGYELMWRLGPVRRVPDPGVNTASTTVLSVDPKWSSGCSTNIWWSSKMGSDWQLLSGRVPCTWKEESFTVLTNASRSSQLQPSGFQVVPYEGNIIGSWPGKYPGYFLNTLGSW